MLSNSLRNVLSEGVVVKSRRQCGARFISFLDLDRTTTACLRMFAALMDYCTELSLQVETAAHKT
jgi:hypothetical protein